MIRSLLAACATLAFATPALAQRHYDERPAKLLLPTAGMNYERRILDIPMRDGVKLHTVILTPTGAKDAAMLLTRSPYNAEKMSRNVNSGDLGTALYGYDNATDVIVDGGYIRVIQDVRGMYGSQGIYMMNPSPAGSTYNPTKTDDSTDAYDTIDWLVKNVKQSNGRVGVLGISYDGYEALTPLIHPHPALKVAVPMNPMVDGWRGDDWFHNGAFRQFGLSYIWEQIASRDASVPWVTSVEDQYDLYMRAGSAGALAKAQGLDQIGFWRKVAEHPAYDDFWQNQAMDKLLAAQPLTVPVMLVHSLWDQEDIYGAPAVYRALEPKDPHNDMVYLSMGPWHHGQEIDEGSSLGAIKFGGDTAKWWRSHVLVPFLAHYLKDQPMDVAPVTAFETGTDEWRRLDAWPAAPAQTPLYLQPGGGLAWTPATVEASGTATEDYVSDPAHPVLYEQRPNAPQGYDNNPWPTWLADDQRAVSTRPDVLTFTGPLLTAPVKISGQPEVHLTAATSGTDSDWVVKLIDVYPDQVPSDRKMGGYQLAVAMDIFRGRYRESLSEAKPLTPGKPLAYQWALPQTNHVFLPGHRIMVQVQSSWFPLYDRNPQKFVPNIMFAKPADYLKATQQVSVAGPGASYVALPVVN